MLQKADDQQVQGIVDVEQPLHDPVHLRAAAPLAVVQPEDRQAQHHAHLHQYRNYYGKLMAKLGIPKLKYHGLRHSFATRCIEAGCDYKTVSVLLGHSNISTTLDLYVHPNMEQKKRCIAKVFKSLGK